MTTENGPNLEELDVFVGVWRMTSSFAPEGEGPKAETSFEWLEGRRPLVQRWRVEHPDAPDGIAVIGWDDNTIAGTWESSSGGSTWEHDFDLTYTRTPRLTRRR